jgi:hypothetical protein
MERQVMAPRRRAAGRDEEIAKLIARSDPDGVAGDPTFGFFQCRSDAQCRIRDSNAISARAPAFF